MYTKIWVAMYVVTTHKPETTYNVETYIDDFL